MAQHALVEIEMPLALERFKLPDSVNRRLQTLLDRQDGGRMLTAAERKEAEGLVELAEMLSLLRLRAQRIWVETPHSAGASPEPSVLTIIYSPSLQATTIIDCSSPAATGF